MRNLKYQNWGEDKDWMNQLHHKRLLSMSFEVSNYRLRQSHGPIIVLNLRRGGLEDSPVSDFEN